MTTSLENLKMSGNFADIGQMAGISIKSGNRQGISVSGEWSF